MRLGHRTAGGSFSIRARSFTRSVYCEHDLPADLFEALLHGDADQLLSRATPLQLKDRCATARLDHPAGPLLIKRHVWGDWWRTTRMLLRVPTARVSAALGLKLVQAGVPTPRPRATVESGFGPLGSCSYLLTNYVEGTSLYRFVRGGSASSRELAHLASQVAEIWQRLIDLRISHNDLKPENFIVDPTAKIWVIDFERPRSHRDETDLRHRHLADLKRFLHVRSWQTQPDAAEPFRRELLKTTLGRWLDNSSLAIYPGLRGNYSAQQLAGRLSVVVMIHDASGPNSVAATNAKVAAAIDSARDIADEIMVVSPTSPGAWQVVERLDEPGKITAKNSSARFNNGNHVRTGRPKHPWVLILQSGDCVTPELARQLPEQIVDRTDCDAYRIPIEARSSGRRAAGSPAQAPIRLFHQERCSFSLRRGELSIAADPARVGQFVEKLRHDPLPAVIVASPLAARAETGTERERRIRRAA